MISSIYYMCTSNILEVKNEKIAVALICTDMILGTICCPVVSISFIVLGIFAFLVAVTKFLIHLIQGRLNRDQSCPTCDYDSKIKCFFEHIKHLSWMKTKWIGAIPGLAYPCIFLVSVIYDRFHSLSYADALKKSTIFFGRENVTSWEDDLIGSDE